MSNPQYAILNHGYGILQNNTPSLPLGFSRSICMNVDSRTIGRNQDLSAQSMLKPVELSDADTVET